MIRDLQKKHESWSKTNFGHKPRESVDPLLGIGEEYGELLHHFLKRKQGIRMEEDHDVEIVDALADIFIYMLDFANREGIDLQDAIMDTIEYVHKRDWVKYPDSGGRPNNVGIDGTAGVNLPILNGSLKNKVEGEEWPLGKKTSES